MDEVILRRFKGTGNMKRRSTWIAKIAEKVNLPGYQTFRSSGTRREEPADERKPTFQKSVELRKLCHSMTTTPQGHRCFVGIKLKDTKDERRVLSSL